MAGGQFARWSGVMRSGSGLAAVMQTGVATVLVLGINVVTGILSARVLGPQGRGELSALLLCPQFLSFLFALGLPTASIVRIQSHPNEAAGLMGTALLLSTIAGLIAALVGWAVVPRLLQQYDPALLRVARVFLVFVMLGVPSTVLVAALQIHNRFGAYNRMRLGQCALTLVALFGLAAVGSFNPASGALAYTVPTLFFLAWNVHWLMREFRPTFSRWRAQAGALLSYGWRMQLLDIGNTFLGQLDKIIVVTLLAPSAFGLYVVVFNLSRLVTTFAMSATPVLLPRAAGRTLNEVRTLTIRAFSATTLLAGAAILGFTLLGRVALHLLYGNDFVSGYGTLVLLALEGALASAAAVLQQPYLVLNRPGTVACLQALSLGVAAPAIYLGARHLGAVGAAAGLLVATTVRFCLTYSGWQRVLGLEKPPLLPSRTEVSSLFHRFRTLMA